MNLSAFLIVAATVALAATGCSSSKSNPDGSVTKDGNTGGTGGGGAGTGGSAGSGGTTPPVDAAGGGSGNDGGARDAGADNRVDSGAQDRPTDLGGGNTDSGSASGRGPAGGGCPAGAVFGPPLPDNPTATVVRNGFTDPLLEAPVWIAAQRALYFSEIGRGVTEGRLHKFTPADNSIVVFAQNVGVGGLAVDAQGMLIAASHDGQKLTRFDPATGQRTDVAGGTMYMGLPFNQVNDVVVRADGNMYFSDPEFKLAGRPGQGVMAFYRLSPAGIATRIATAMNANGVALSPDGATLYLSTTGGPPLQRYGLAADGSITGVPTTLVNGRSDGMAVDCAGNLYLSDDDIKVYSPSGQPLGNIGGLTEGFVTNSAFGGDDRKTLYITTSEALYQIRLNVPGFPN